MTQARTPMTCDAAKQAIEVRRFVGWHGLPAGCAPDAVFGIPLDDTWGAMPLGSTPEATFDWMFGTVAMPAGELVYAKRGLTIFLNPENQAVAYIRLYAATTVEEYARRLRPPREKRPR